MNVVGTCWHARIIRRKGEKGMYKMNIGHALLPIKMSMSPYIPPPLGLDIISHNLLYTDDA